MSVPDRVRRLSAVDASNLAFEHDGAAYSIGLVGVLDGGPLAGDDGEPDVGRLRRLLGPRVASLEALNRRVHFTRWGQGLPVWVACPADLSAHVRLGPPLAGDADVAALCGRLMSEPLPRDRPLWDLTVCSGPARGRVTAVLRLHHALADGVGGVRLLASLFDDAPATSRTGGPLHAPAAQRPPTGGELAADAWRARLRALGSLPQRLRRLPVATRTLLTGAVRTAAVVRGGLPPTSLLGPVGARKGVVLATADLATVHATARACGGTVNDVLLGSVAGAAASLLTARGEALPPTLPVSVPVSLRSSSADESGDESGPTANRVGVMLAPLPLRVDDPDERVRLIAEVTRQAKAEARQAGTFELTRSRLGTRVFDVLARHQRTIGLFVTNVPGPTRQLRLGGAELLHAWPLSTLGGNVRLAVAALSYAGTLRVTVTYDQASSPDADRFAATLLACLSGGDS